MKVNSLNLAIYNLVKLLFVRYASLV